MSDEATVRSEQDRVAILELANAGGVLIRPVWPPLLVPRPRRPRVLPEQV